MVLPGDGEASPGGHGQDAPDSQGHLAFAFTGAGGLHKGSRSLPEQGCHGGDIVLPGHLICVHAPQDGVPDCRTGSSQGKARKEHAEVFVGDHKLCDLLCPLAGRLSIGRHSRIPGRCHGEEAQKMQDGHPFVIVQPGSGAEVHGGGHCCRCTSVLRQPGEQFLPVPILDEVHEACQFLIVNVRTGDGCQGRQTAAAVLGRALT